MRWEARAFGIPFEGEHPLMGLVPAEDPGPEPRTVVEYVTASELEEETGQRGQLVRELLAPNGEVQFSFYHHEDFGFHFETAYFGSHHLSSDGLRIKCVPADRPSWEWQRMLVSQILPSAAAVRGLAIFHASAVVLHGHALAFIVYSGGGKSSLALNLMLRGAHFLADDVAAISTDGELAVHPGAAVANLAQSEMALMSAEELQRLGALLDVSEHDKALMSVKRHEHPAPLTALYFLDRAGAGERAQITPVSSPDPGLLLGSGHAYDVLTPSRLKNQLDVCARLASEVPMFEVSIPGSVGARSLAETVEAHASSLIERG